MTPAVFWELLKRAAEKWLEDKASRMGAALAYYTIFSMAPLLVITVAVAGLVFGREAAEGKIIGQLRELVGEEGGQLIQTMLANASEPAAGIIATVSGVVVLLFGAMGVFGELQDALNTIWGVRAKAGRRLWTIIRERFLWFVMVMGVAFLLLVSLVVSAALAVLNDWLGDGEGLFGRAAGFILSLTVIAVLFAMIYRYLPEARTAWKDVWLGAGLTALLFDLGKFLIGLYLGKSALASTYGAAGCLAVLLVWLYYSAQIFLFGAELTKVFADYDRQVKSDRVVRHANVTDREVVSPGRS